jgi:hypothetical protein
MELSARDSGYWRGNSLRYRESPPATQSRNRLADAPTIVEMLQQGYNSETIFDGFPILSILKRDAKMPQSAGTAWDVCRDYCAVAAEVRLQSPTRRCKQFPGKGIRSSSAGFCVPYEARSASWLLD